MINTNLYLVVVVLTATQFAAGQTESQRQSSDARMERRATYTKLSRKIFHTYDDGDSGGVKSTDEANAIQAELQHVLREEIADTIKLANYSESDVINAVQAISGGTPFVKIVDVNSTNSLAIGYVISRGDQAIPDTQPYLELWGELGASWSIRAEAPTHSDFRGHTFVVAALNSRVPSEAWFLTWGMQIGDTGARIKMRLYAVNATGVRTVWKRDGLLRGEVSVSNARVLIDYDRDYRSSGAANRVHETLHVGPWGLE